MTLLKRIFAEKQSIVLPLAIAIIINLAVHGLVVRPLTAKSAGTADRAAAAASALKAAERDAAAAQALVTGKNRADEALSTFYEKVIPANYPTARRMTQALVPTLAQKASVKYEAARYERAAFEKNSRLGQLKIRIVLQGNYDSVRRFIYALETAPEFVIIDDLSLAQSDLGKPLMLTLGLSTYYRLDVNGR